MVNKRLMSYFWPAKQFYLALKYHTTFWVAWFCKRRDAFERREHLCSTMVKPGQGDLAKHPFNRWITNKQKLVIISTLHHFAFMGYHC